MQGEGEVVFGRLILSLLTDCRRMGLVAVERERGGGIVAVGGDREVEEREQSLDRLVEWDEVETGFEKD